MSDKKNEETGQNTMPENTSVKAEIIVPKYNLLKNKAGARVNMRDNGFIEKKKIEAADDLIAQLCDGSKEKIEEQIKILMDLWKRIQEMPDSIERKEKTQEIFTIAHEIKDIGSLCGYILIAHFAESLRDYIAETTMNLKNQRVIIQAHIDALNTVLKTGVSDNGDPIAEELKSKVKIAIEKYK